MDEKQLTTIGTFCLNEACEDYQKVNHGNMIKYGKTDSGVLRYHCKTCKKAFVETKGTMFYRIRHSEEEVVECMEMLADRSSLAAIHLIRGSKLVGVKVKVIYGNPEEVKALLGEHTAYVERTNLTSRQMNGWLVRKTLS